MNSQPVEFINSLLTPPYDKQVFIICNNGLSRYNCFYTGFGARTITIVRPSILGYCSTEAISSVS